MEGFTIQPIRDFTVVEFYDTALMDPSKLEPLGQQLYHLVEEEDHRLVVLDFARVQYISSQFIGILMAMKKKMAPGPKSRLILCSVNKRLTELLHITRLDKVFEIKTSQKEAIQV